jgi:hypothetical protein
MAQFGDYIHPRMIRETNDGAHDRRPFVIGDIRNEGTVDFDRIERETVQIIQRSIAMAVSASRRISAGLLYSPVSIATPMLTDENIS